MAAATPAPIPQLLPGAPIPPGEAVPGDASASDPAKENVEKALMQLYGMGHGINAYPTGVAQANPFLHPAMFSASTGRTKSLESSLPSCLNDVICTSLRELRR